VCVLQITHHVLGAARAQQVHVPERGEGADVGGGLADEHERKVPTLNSGIPKQLDIEPVVEAANIDGNRAIDADVLWRLGP
jgi:hypothetical protein